MTVTLYTRQGCHLCEAAERTVREVAAGRAEVVVVDIDGDPALRDRYTVRVPVVAVDGVEVAQFEVSREMLLDALATVGNEHPGGMTGPTTSDEDLDQDDAEVYLRRPMPIRLLWAAVFVLGGATLLMILTLVTLATVTPQFFVESCHRAELFTPASCGPEEPSPSLD